jgi:formylmethanofuran dehydrogenase subunit E
MKLEDYAKAVKDFHGTLAPGLLVGGFMVDLAYKNLPKGEFFDAVSEASGCLPDAIQLLTPCSIGNGWLKIKESGRFALTLYEKYTGEGVRVSMDPKALDAWPEIRNWFLKLVPKCEQDQDRLIAEIIQAGASILAIESTEVDTTSCKKTKGQQVFFCPECHEPYPQKFGERCGYCSGSAVYYRRK